MASNHETKDAVCFRALKWLVRPWKGFETETKKVRNKIKYIDKINITSLMGFFGRANGIKQLGEIKLFHRYQLCLFIALF